MHVPSLSHDVSSFAFVVEQRIGMKYAQEYPNSTSKNISSSIDEMQLFLFV